MIGFKKKFLILVIMCSSCAALSYDFLYPINDKNGGGYIDKSGTIKIEQKYNFALRFVGNYAIVQGKNLKYGVTDKIGNTVVDFKYEDLKNLSEDFVIYKEGKNYGFIDIKNNRKSEAIFEDIKKFQEGLAAAKSKGKWGFINQKGEFKIEPKYYDVGSFKEGLAAVSLFEHKTSGYINKKGKIKISFEDNSLEPKEFSEGLAPVIKEDENSCSYINKRGKIVLDSKKMYPIKLYCGNFYEGLNVFYIDNKPNEVTTGYVDKKGKIKYFQNFLLPQGLLKEEFGVFENYNYGMAQFTLDYRTGYLNNKFQTAIPPVYEFAQDFIGDLAYLKFEDKEGYINKKGEWVWSKEREGM